MEGKGSVGRGEVEGCKKKEEAGGKGGKEMREEKIEWKNRKEEY